MWRPSLIILWLAAGLLSGPGAVAAQRPNQTPSLPAFQFHSGFWVNLHHFLYLQGRLRQGASQARTSPTPAQDSYTQSGSLDGLTAAEQKAWNASVAAYAADWSSRALLNNDMALINNRLAELENCQQLLQDRGPSNCISGLRPQMIAALNQAAPVYRAHWWPRQDRENRTWIAEVAPLVRQMGEFVGGQLVELYQRRWPPGALAVDVVWYAGAQGAYTSRLPIHVTLSSRDPRNQGLAGFEALFDAASDPLAEAVNEAIARECRKRGIPIPRNLREALVFYTAGEMVRRALARQPSGSAVYTAYSHRNRLSEYGWSEYEQVLSRYWQPYLDGELGFDAAISRMISSL